MASQECPRTSITRQATFSQTWAVSRCVVRQSYRAVGCDEGVLFALDVGQEFSRAPQWTSGHERSGLVSCSGDERTTTSRQAIDATRFNSVGCCWGNRLSRCCGNVGPNLGVVTAGVSSERRLQARIAAEVCKGQSGRGQGAPLQTKEQMGASLVVKGPECRRV